MYKGLDLKFEYAIRFADGTYYTGRAGAGYKGTKSEAFTYTEKGAHAKLERVGRAGNDFWHATVEKVI